MKRVVIVGMGFGGLRAARVLAGKGLEIILLDRKNYHLFQPLLYQVATAALEEESIAYPIRAMARQWKETRFRMEEVCGVDLEQRQVFTAGGVVEYDYLILAAGCVTNFFGLKGIESYAYDLKTLGGAVDCRNHILASFENASKEPDPSSRQSSLTFVIVGGGPTGVEFAGALAEVVRFILTGDYPELRPEDVRILLVEEGESLLAMLPEKLQIYALNRVRQMGVEVMFNTRVVGADPGRIILQDGTAISARTLFWSAGVRAAPLADALNLQKVGDGRIKVQPDLTIPGHPEVFVVGDMAYLEKDGRPLPMVAQVAMQGGEYAARAILCRERDAPIAPFRYRDKGTMAAIGRNAAVANAFGISLSGFFAWLAWLGLHIFYLIGFRNRLVVLLDWAYSYILHKRQVSLITNNSMPQPRRAAAINEQEKEL